MAFSFYTLRLLLTGKLASLEEALACAQYQEKEMLQTKADIEKILALLPDNAACSSSMFAQCNYAKGQQL